MLCSGTAILGLNLGGMTGQTICSQCFFSIAGWCSLSGRGAECSEDRVILDRAGHAHRADIIPTSVRVSEMSGYEI